MEELVPLIVRLLLPSLAETAPLTEPALIEKVSSPVPELTAAIVPAEPFMVRLLVPSPRSRVPVRETPLPLPLTVAVSLPVERLRFSIELKDKPSIVPLLTPLIATVLSPVLSVMLSPLLLPPTRVSKPIAVPAMAVAPPAAVLPVLLEISVRVTETALE